MHQKWSRRICLPRSPFATLCLGSAPILDPRSRSRSGLLTQISNSDLGLGFSNRMVKSIRQFHQDRSRSIGIWSFRGYLDDMKHKVDPTDPTPINWGDDKLVGWQEQLAASQEQNKTLHEENMNFLKARCMRVPVLCAPPQTKGPLAQRGSKGAPRVGPPRGYLGRSRRK